MRLWVGTTKTVYPKKKKPVLTQKFIFDAEDSTDAMRVALITAENKSVFGAEFGHIEVIEVSTLILPYEVSAIWS